MSWAIFSILAASLQTLRNLEQKELNKKLDVFTVSWSRFILPIPISLAVIFLTIKNINHNFLIYCFITAIFQIAGNICILNTIRSRNYSVGIVFYKTEIVQAAIIGFLFFSQTISLLGCAAIALASIGMFLMSNIKLGKDFKKFTNSLDQASIYGALSGFCFSISAFNLQFATQELSGLNYSSIGSPLITLFWVIAFQNLFFSALKLQQNSFKKDLKKLFNSENKFAFIRTSLLSLFGSICWFLAYSIGNVVYVKAVGQIELIFAVFISHFYFKEKHNLRDAFGIILTSIAILVLIIFH